MYSEFNSKHQGPKGSPLPGAENTLYNWAFAMMETSLNKITPMRGNKSQFSHMFNGLIAFEKKWRTSSWAATVPKRPPHEYVSGTPGSSVELQLGRNDSRG